MSTPDVGGFGQAPEAVVIRVANPAGGQGFTLAVPGQHYWQPLTLRYRLVTGAVAGSRFPNLHFDDGSVDYLRIWVPEPQAAGATRDYDFARALGSNFGGAASGAFSLPLPDLLLPPGHRIRLVATAFDGGDQVSQVAMLVRQWPALREPDAPTSGLVDPRIAELALG